MGGKSKGHVALEGGFQKGHDWLWGGQNSQKIGHVVYGWPLTQWPEFKFTQDFPNLCGLLGEHYIKLI